MSQDRPDLKHTYQITRSIEIHIKQGTQNGPGNPAFQPAFHCSHERLVHKLFWRGSLAVSILHPVCGEKREWRLSHFQIQFKEQFSKAMEKSFPLQRMPAILDSCRESIPPLSISFP
jgi:hypothetical protein